MRIPQSSVRRCYILVFSLLLLTASVGPASGQEGRVTFSGTHLTAGKALSEIQSQSPYVFAFNRQFDTGAPVRFAQADMPIKEALSVISSNGRFRTLSHNNYIVIVPNDEAEAPVLEASTLTSDRYRPTDRSLQNLAPQQRPDSLNDTENYIIDRVVTLVPGEPTARDYPAPYSAYQSASAFSKEYTAAPRLAVKTNLLYWAALQTPNLSLEYGTGAKHTIELSGSYRWWGREVTPEKQHKQLSHWLLLGEYRRWTCERLNGSYVGVHALYSRYYVSGRDLPLLFEKAHSYDGWALGAGVSYGYHWALGRRWGVEVNIGLGYAYLRHDRGSCLACDPQAARQTKHYFGPTRAGVRLVYLLR